MCRNWQCPALRSRGGFGADSDVDFLVDFLPDRQDLFEGFCALRDELREAVQRDVPLVKRSIGNPCCWASALPQAATVYIADAQCPYLGCPAGVPGCCPLSMASMPKSSMGAANPAAVERRLEILEEALPRLRRTVSGTATEIPDEARIIGMRNIIALLVLPLLAPSCSMVSQIGGI